MIYGIAVGVAALLFFLSYLVFAFALNVASLTFWVVLWGCILIGAFIARLIRFEDSEGIYMIIVGILGIGIPVCLLLAGIIDLFLFKNLAGIAPEVKTVEITEMFPNKDTIIDDAIVDTKTAEKNANKVLGTLGTIGSRYVATEYFVVSMRDSKDSECKMKRVTPLGYDGFWRYCKYKYNGIPGYIKSNTTDTGSAFYQELEKPIYYSPTSFFGTDLHRHLRFSYPTLLLGASHFELDDEGKAFWITPYYRRHILFGGNEVIGTIVTDANTGTCWAYNLGAEPAWVSCVYSGDYVCDIYSWKGQYFNGLLNALFGKEGCWKTTEVTGTDSTSRDYAYKFRDGAIWSVTGVKTLASDTRSTMAVLMVNQKTNEALWCDVAGADEEAVMTTACEEYHAYEYGASFPSLISIDGELTYVCVVTDKEFVVKNWVFINMKDISKLITAKSETEGFEKYRQLLKKGSITTTTETEVNTENADDIEQIDGVRLYTENGITFVEIDTNGTTVKYKVSQ